MKVLFVSRSTFESVPGGDTVQLKKTAKYLGRLGVEVDIYKKEIAVDFEQYDLIHFFNLTRPATILAVLSKTNRPYVVSSILMDYSFYQNIPEAGMRGKLTKYLGGDGIEYIKALAKFILAKESIGYWPYLFLGQKRSIQKVLKQSLCILPNSNHEGKRVCEKYDYDGSTYIIPNGVDLEEFSRNENIVRKPKQVTCVARIEPQKNQLNLIRALKDTDYKLKIVGYPAPNHRDYYERCKKEAGTNVEFTGHITFEELFENYQESQVHVLPSWFETCGLSSLEAAHLGCRIVVSTGGDTKDYFKGKAVFCEPNDIQGIRKAIDKAAGQNENKVLQEAIKTKYNWAITAQETLKAYKAVLNKH